MKTDSEKSYEDFCFEITTTQACNFKCEYCFENDCEVPDDNVVTTRIDEVMQVMKNSIFQNRTTIKQTHLWKGLSPPESVICFQCVVFCPEKPA